MTELQPTKICRRCDREKLLDGFTQSGKARDGRHSWCRTCLRIYQHIRRDMDPSVRARDRAYQARPENREKRRERDRKRDLGRAAYFLAYRTSAHGKLVYARGKTLARLRVETDPLKQADMKRTVLKIQADIERFGKNKPLKSRLEPIA